MSEKLSRLYVEGRRLHQSTSELIKPAIENVAKFSMPFLLKGRKEKYDVFHSLNVDYFVTQIARAEGLDELVLRTAAWLHDTGNSQNQENHIEHSLKIANNFFKYNQQNYTPEQIDIILKIIKNHNSPQQINTLIELAFMEGDVISAVATDKNKFNKRRDGLEYFKNHLTPEIMKFRTPTGINLLEQHLPDFMQSLYNLS